MSKYVAVLEIDNHLFRYNVELLLNNCDGNYVKDYLIPGERRVWFPVAGEDDGYYISNGSDEWNVILDGKEVTEPKKLAHGSYLTVSSKDSFYGILILDEDQAVITTYKIAVKEGQHISIGRNPENHIVLDINNSIHRKHAVIRIGTEGAATVEDLAKRGSGVFVNGERITSVGISCGDVIEIMGSSICFMGTYLLFSKNIKNNKLDAWQPVDVMRPVEKEKADTYFRTPRIFKSLQDTQVVIESPPEPHRQKEVPFILTAGPSITMAMAMMASFGFTLSQAIGNRNVGSTITGGTMVVSMLLGALMWPSLLRKYNKKQAERDERYRIQKYRSYLEEKESEIAKMYDWNTRVWNEYLQPSIGKLSHIIRERDIQLWERTWADRDFLEVRLGSGERKFEAEIQYPQKKFELYGDKLVDEAIELGCKYQMLKDVPVTVSLMDGRTVGLVGTKDEIENMVRNIIFNIAALHSPEDVKICLLCNELQYENMAWVRELPHCWNTSRTMRYVAGNITEAYRLFNHLEVFIQEREARLSEGELRTPHIVAIVLDETLAKELPFYRYMIAPDNGVGVSAVFAAERFAKLPKECEVVIQDEKDICGVYIKNEKDNRFREFTPDSISAFEAEELSRSLAKIQVKVEKINLSVPEKVDFLGMYKVGKVEDLLIRQRWDNNMSDESLAVPIGVRAGGEPFYLDIHEDYHGCHGLVAGMTGSGKSEFLQAYILSAILNYSPNELAFVLVDFKGGDMARPFLKIPHLAATISDLSGNILYRALVSLDAEIAARKEMFNESAALLNIDKIDINSYQKFFKEGRLSAPLPHLVIVIDEFAQLKSQHPEFMSKLIDIAQVGRSLGVHLILATQKPSGVVDPQIWSNSRFKVCLKVLDKQDSKEMIHRSDAAFIKLPGRAYVQVGYDEIFEQIQSGYSGAPYVPKEVFADEDEVTVKLVDSTATSLRIAKNIKVSSKTGKTQLEETVAEVIRIASAKNVKVKQLWLDVLPDELYLEECIGERPSEQDSDRDISAVCGKLDLIAAQKQIPYEISFVRDGHLSIYGTSGTGKTTLIQTIIFSFAHKYSPEMLNIFALDFGGRNLGNLMELPHCINAAYGDEYEKVFYIVGQIEACIETRKKLFSNSNCGNYESYLESSGNKLPAVLFVLDNYAAFREKMPTLEDSMVRIAANAKTYGVYLILTGNSRNAIFYKLAEHIENHIMFRMNDRANYRDILNIPVPVEPENVRGRGIVAYGKEAVEVQIALPLKAENESERLGKVRQIYQRIAENYHGENPAKNYQIEVSAPAVAAPVPAAAAVSTQNVAGSTGWGQELPTVEDDGDSLVIGVSHISGQLMGFHLSAMKHLFVGVNGDYYPDRLIKRTLSFQDSKVYLVMPREGETGNAVKVVTESEIHEMVEELLQEAAERLESYKMLESEGLDREMIYGNMKMNEKIFVIIEDFCSFFDMLSNDDLKRLVFTLRGPEMLCIYFITIDQIERMDPYRDSGLYTMLIKCEKGMVTGGQLDDYKAGGLYHKVPDIPLGVRMKKLAENQALVYDGQQHYSVVVLD